MKSYDLDEHVKCSIYQASGARTEQAQSARPAPIGPMISDLAETLAHALVAEPYSSSSVGERALHAGFYSKNFVTRAVAACPSARWHDDVTKRP